MKDYRYGAHSVFDIRLHLVWVTKYRYPVLTGKISYRVRELVRQLCEAHEVNILSGVVSSDHVHLYVSVPPQLSASKLVMKLKGRNFWARGYFCASSGNVTDEMIREYIAKHAEKPSEEIRVEGEWL